jgi:hypothetical protein
VTSRPRSVDSGLPVFEVVANTWMWGLVVSHLPESEPDGLDTSDFIGSYHAIAVAVAAESVKGASVQIRLNTSGITEGGIGVVSPVILGRATSEAAAAQLLHLVRAALPTGMIIDLIGNKNDLDRVLAHVDTRQPNNCAFVEIRRVIEELDSDPVDVGGERADDADLLEPAVLSWSPRPFGLRHGSTILAQHPSAATVLLHMEAGRPSRDVLEYLEAQIALSRRDSGRQANPLRAQVFEEYRRKLRDFMRRSLHVRVLLVAKDAIAPGLIQAVGVELTASGFFRSVALHQESDIEAARDLTEDLLSRREATAGQEVQELVHLFDTLEAAKVVRLPTPEPGGTPGLSSVKINRLPRSSQFQGEKNRQDGPSGVHLGPAVGGGAVDITEKELNQHLLVAGLPGFGKTITVQSIMYRLWSEKQKPFLVLDPAKKDYRHLVRAIGGSARLIQLGPDYTAFNPFGVPRECSPRVHAGRVLAAFDAALGLSGHWPAGYITLGRAIFAAYRTAGNEGSAPTLPLLKDEIDKAITRAGFVGTDGSNIRASLMGRMEFLTDGPLGESLLGGQADVIDYEALLSSPTVIEMGQFVGPTERSLVFALLLAGLLTYREKHPSKDMLGHVIVLEEAHRILGGQNSGQSEGIRLFIEAIAEQRGSGQGYVVVDQAPSMLHPGVLKLAGSMISHRLVDAAERSIIGSSLLLAERQHEDLARLRAGQVVLYSAERTASVAVDVSAAEPLIVSMAEKSFPDDKGEQLPMLAIETSSTSINEMAFSGLKRRALAYLEDGRNPWEVTAELTREVLNISSDRDQAEEFLIRLSRTMQQGSRRKAQRLAQDERNDGRGVLR